MPLEVVEGGEAWHVVDRRGHLVAGYPTPAEAAAFVAGYSTGRGDAQNAVREVAERLGKLARA
jgi:hypothetical protein